MSAPVAFNTSFCEGITNQTANINVTTPLRLETPGVSGIVKVVLVKARGSIDILPWPICAAWRGTMWKCPIGNALARFVTVFGVFQDHASMLVSGNGYDRCTKVRIHTHLPWSIQHDYWSNAPDYVGQCKNYDNQMYILLCSPARGTTAM